MFFHCRFVEIKVERYKKEELDKKKIDLHLIKLPQINNIDLWQGGNRQIY